MAFFPKHRFLKTKKILSILFVFFLYDILFIKSPLSFFQNILGLRYGANYLISLIVLLLFILILDNLYQRKWPFKILASVLLVVPLGIQTAHYAFYAMPLNAYGVRFFLHEPSMTTQLALENVNYAKVFGFVLFSCFLIFLFLRKKEEQKNTLYPNLKLAIYSFFYIPLLVLCGVNWYLILDYQNPMVSVYAVLPEVGRSFYFKQLKANKPQIVLAPTKNKLPNILWIIGESVVKSHMSLYGYNRPTTPQLDALRDKGELFPFQNVVSIGPHTIISVPYMMVGMQNIDPQGKIYSTPNVFEYAKARGYETAFISSQDLRWRNFDQLVGGNGLVDFFRSGPDFSPNVSVAKGADDMKVLDQSILPHLKQMRAPFFMVAHMDGSHYPYSLHSEQKYKVFLPENNPNSINAYDNTLVYSDVYLSRLIEAARKKDPNIWIFYTTDHGQPVEVPPEFAPKNKQIEKKVSLEGVPDIKLVKNKVIEKPLTESQKKQEIEHTLFAEWRKKIELLFDQNSNSKEDGKIIFNQGYNSDIIHNAFFVVPPENFKDKMRSKLEAPVAQSDIFATVLALMDISKPAAHTDGISLLGEIPKNRLRVSTGFVTTNDNVPEAQVTYPNSSSAFVDFSRKSVSFEKNKIVVPLDEAPKEIQDLFPSEK
jgi:glucan phosphoethanolaminetransferase (alkaline phosphatase superfamily)